MIVPYSRSSRGGFTLVELITVVSVIVVLFALVAGAYSYADQSSKRSRTEVTIRVIRSALENYREKFGSYPTPANPETSVTIADKTYVAGEAACLYQALSGDGFNQIKGVDSNQGSPIPTDKLKMRKPRMLHWPICLVKFGRSTVRVIS